jgi:hypothetical protein
MPLNAATILWFVPLLYLIFTYKVRANAFVHAAIALSIVVVLLIFRQQFFVPEETLSMNYAYLLTFSTLLSYILIFVKTRRT